MEIETVEDLTNVIADWIGCYGACKSEDPDGCQFSEDKINCCRVGFTYEMGERIRTSVDNERKLESLDLR